MESLVCSLFTNTVSLGRECISKIPSITPMLGMAQQKNASSLGLLKAALCRNVKRKAKSGKLGRKLSGPLYYYFSHDLVMVMASENSGGFCFSFPSMRWNVLYIAFSVWFVIWQAKIIWQLLPAFFRIAGKLLGCQNVVINMSGTSYFIWMLQERDSVRRHQCCQLPKIIALGKSCSTSYTFHFKSTILHWKKTLIPKTVKLIRTLCYQLDRKWENVNLISSLCMCICILVGQKVKLFLSFWNWVSCLQMPFNYLKTKGKIIINTGSTFFPLQATKYNIYLRVKKLHPLRNLNLYFYLFTYLMHYIYMPPISMLNNFGRFTRS